VDFLAPNYDIIARFQGGPNAGHTLEFDGIKHVLHQIPSGIFRENCANVVGNGVVIDPAVFRKEASALEQYGVTAGDKILMSNKAHLILPTHKILDAVIEKAKAGKKIGSTLRGIGPTYQDKIARHGFRVGDILSADFEEKLSAQVKWHQEIISGYGNEEVSVDLDEFLEGVEYLRTLKIVNTEYFLNEALKEGKSILAEGAQGSMLDVDFGSYPFVTSSNTTVAGVCSGLGVNPKKIGEVFGIAKAYCTRVGSGPFPTELFDETGAYLQEAGHEFGATTGRPRRCGWLDMVALNYSCMINGVTQLFLMKLDVLNGLDQIKIAEGYIDQDNKESSQVPFDLSGQVKELVFSEHKGWNKNLEGVKAWGELPQEAQDYIKAVEQGTGVPIKLISTGPNRSETITV
jgi:adenylosuccinate synthase